MSETGERVEAAATGAAAAVAAVEDQQADEARAERQEAATELATDAAATAAQEAQDAAAAATAAATAAEAATTEATAASDVADAAAAEAYDVRSDMERLHDSVQRGWADMRSYLEEKFNKPVSDEPTEVVVTHDDKSDNATEPRSDGGSSGGAGPGTPRRHKFGSRRG